MSVMATPTIYASSLSQTGNVWVIQTSELLSYDTNTEIQRAQ